MPTLKKNTLVLLLLIIAFVAMATFQVKAQSIANYLSLKDKIGNNEVILHPDTNTLGYNLFFPTTVPTAGSVLAVNTLSGTQAKLAWKAPNTFAWSLTGNSGTSATTNFLGTTDNNPLRLFTNNIERMRILGSGNVGIGTSSPAAQLHVKGDAGGIILERTAGTAPFDQGFLKIINKDGGAFQMRSSSGANDGFNITNGDATKNYITGLTSGNIGVGTTSPANKLEITQGTAGNSGLRFTNLTSASAATTTSSKVLALNSTGDVILTNVPGTQNIVEFAVNANPNTTGTTFTPNTPSDSTVVYQSAIDNSLWTYNGTAYVTYTAPPSTPFYLTEGTNDAGSNKTSNIYRTGSVGIGTSTPTGKLHVSFPSATLQPIWERLNSGGGTIAAASGQYLLNNQGTALSSLADNTVGTGFSFSFKSNTETEKTTAAILGGLTNYTAGTGYLNFIVNGNTTIAPAMRIASSGNVGIGTTTPTSKLEVNGSATNTTAYNAGSATAILFGNSNLAYTTANPGSFNLQGIKDGGTYTLAVRGTTSGTSSFISLGFTFLSVNNGPTMSGKQTLYTFIVMGTTVYVYMATGF